MTQSHDQKVMFMTGASSGLGLAMAQEFKKHGFYVISASRKAPPEGVCDEFIPCDLSDDKSRENLVKNLLERPRIDVLINNAGLGSYGTWNEMSEKDLRYIMELDFFIPMLLTKSLLPKLRESKGAVINTASVASKIPLACMGIYSAAKASLYMFSETLRMEERDLSVVTVCPGRISTGFWNNSTHYRDVPDSPSTNLETPEGLAKRVYKYYRKHKWVLVYPSWYRLVWSVVRNLPGVYQYLSRRAWKI